MSKIILLSVSLLLASASGYASEKTSCASQFKHSDDRAFCIAKSQRDKSYCEQIGGGDKKNFCLAQVSGDQQYCSLISSSARQKQCKVMTTNKT